MTVASEHIQFPQSRFVDDEGYVSLEWQQWLLNPQVLTINFSTAVDVASGGTGLTAGTPGGILGFITPTTIASSALLTQHALVIGGGALATPATPVGLGTTTTVLHGNAAGDPSWGAVTASDAPSLAPLASPALTGTPTAPTAAPLDNSTKLATTAYVDAAVTGGLTSMTSSLGADVALNNTANYFDGPSVAQGTSGTWFVSGSVTFLDTSIGTSFYAKLWDGTTVISSGYMNTISASNGEVLALSGVITSPAGNLRISVRDLGSVNGVIKFNQTGNSKDSTITAVRIS